MSRRMRFDRGAAGRRAGIAIAAVLIAVAAGVGVVGARRGSAPAAAHGPSHTANPATGAPSTTGGMQMAGMSMGEGGSAHLTAEQIRHFGITFGTVEERTLTSRVRTVGMIAVDETRLTQVAPKFGGFVERLYVNATGQPVRRGEPLMEVYSPELVAAQEELLVAGNLERSVGRSAVPGMPTSAPSLVAAAKRRLELWDISDAQVDEVLRSGKPRRTLTLHASASGVVLEKNVVQGQAFQPGQMLYTIANLSEVWVEAELREQDANAVRVGSAATVMLAAHPGRPLSGRVAYVYPTLQVQARTVKARIVVPNPERLLKPGMYATVELTTPTRRALTVPTTAVVHTGERAVVFVDMGGGEIMLHDVVLGRVAGDYTEVLSGVDPGQRVVTSAQYLLDSESNLAEVMRSMIGQMGQMESMPGMDMNSKGADVKGAMKDSMPGMPMPPERR